MEPYALDNSDTATCPMLEAILNIIVYVTQDISLVVFLLFQAMLGIY